MVLLIISIFILLCNVASGDKIYEKQLEARLSKTEADIRDLRSGLELLKQQNKQLIAELKSLNTKEKRLLLSTPSHQQYVVFTAKLNKQYNSLNDRETVIFDSIVTNAGQGYDENTGIFVCPISGYYQFAATIVSESGTDKNLDAELMHNGRQIVRLHATVYGYDEGTQVVNIHCAQGERVWIRHLMGVGDSAIMPAGFSTFSGALLHADH
ncbi:complement C1q-like protein 4 isoform X1 [Crassostrea angulata]|uniref:complement C1q-like protein 4 isoform X1 n=1 Tax=Magallana angulata TaxID=2784310 RepID=UPI0022B15160|nr:complement C1q-like protein 4 isoform X1 [Crassostrea angulata]